MNLSENTMNLPENTEQQSPERLYATSEVQQYIIDDATIAVRVFGRGPAVVLIHGYPVHGYTWRKLLPGLAQEFTCYVVDLPGLGDSDWSPDTDFKFTAQAHRLGLLFQTLQLNHYAIIAHDTGATLARLVALLQPDKVAKLVMINTEMPHHRPPWIRFYQFCAKLPFAATTFRTLLRSQMFLRSSMGLGEFYSNAKLFDVPDNIPPYIDPLTMYPKRTQGMLRYLTGIDWSVVDGLYHRHKDIKSDILLIWGEDDKTFPVEMAEEMCRQLTCQYDFVRIKNASLMPQEERPDEVLKHLMPFLRG